MAAIGTQVTWKDVAAGVDPSGKTLAIVEMMNERNEIIADIPMKEGNLQTAHMLSIRDGIPEPTLRRINRGTPVTKATEHAVEFSSLIVEDRGEIDELLVKLQKEPEMFRIRQNRAHIHGISNKLVEQVFYGDVETTPEGFTGLSAFYSDLSADSGENIIDAGGNDSDLTSMWLVCWAEDMVGGFYPQNMKGGIEHIDKGLEKCEDSDSNVLYKFVDLFRASMGFYVGDWRQAARIANIDLSALETAGDETDSSANLLKYAIQAKHKLYNPSAGPCFWYARSEIQAALEIKAQNKPNVLLNIGQLTDGTPITKLAGYPVHRCDGLLATESRVV